MRFRAVLELGGRTATGIEVPQEVLDGLGGGRRPPVVVSLRGHSWRTTVGHHEGRPMIPVSAEVRADAGVRAGEELDVDVERDDAPREVEVPEDLAAALSAAGLRAAFDALSPSARKEHARQVTSAKAEATRARRVEKVVGALGG